MNNLNESLLKKAYQLPKLRQNIMNSGTMYLYCDYAGFATPNVYGAACCIAYNRTVNTTAKRLLIEQDHGSSYGEMMAIIHSLDTLKDACCAHEPRIAIIYTDYSRISRALVQDCFSHPQVRQGRDDLLAALANINCLFPNVDVQIKYISSHKKNNYLHQMAHNAARDAAFT
ncbi:RNase H family protein [Paenibacillus sp. MMS18-CY102]|uniref:RNase H family protein n=1 Tax=Paenibacillus sp. MMS18-CY102 TaxID=2682849 RepID=UPI00136668F9|nr:RNase H family protein [Paenibacillus sp. MMS18-CY102]MWC30547.1 hypothetical protein [Paenibacillus sp. MMS18-CY102]